MYDIPLDLGIVAYFGAPHDGFTMPVGQAIAVFPQGQNEFVKKFTKSILYRSSPLIPLGQAVSDLAEVERIWCCHQVAALGCIRQYPLFHQLLGTLPIPVNQLKTR